MRLLILLVLALVLVSCTEGNTTVREIIKPELVGRAPSSYGIYKYEDEEVTCYISKGYYSGGIECKWKTP